MDLTKFCNRKRDAHPGMMQPFTQSGKTWATNGYIAIAVPERPDVPVNTMAPDMAKAKPAADPEIWYVIPVVDVSPCKFCEGHVKGFTCPECKGRGYVTFTNDFTEYTHECNTCEGEGEVEECEHCSGTGYDSQKQTDIGGVTFNNRALALIMDLPGVQISPTGPESPAYLKFDGGNGYLMPARKIE